MLWFKFILGLIFIFFCFKIIIIHYHTQKQKKIKFKSSMKLNHNMHKGEGLFLLSFSCHLTDVSCMKVFDVIFGKIV